MSIRLPSGLSLSKAFHASRRRHEWMVKLHNNVLPVLNKIGNIACLANATLKAPGPLHIMWTGKAKDLARIEKVLGIQFTEGDVMGNGCWFKASNVKFRRIRLDVVLIPRPDVIADLDRNVTLTPVKDAA